MNNDSSHNILYSQVLKLKYLFHTKFQVSEFVLFLISKITMNLKIYGILISSSRLLRFCTYLF